LNGRHPHNKTESGAPRRGHARLTCTAVSLPSVRPPQSARSDKVTIRHSLPPRSATVMPTVRFTAASSQLSPVRTSRRATQTRRGGACKKAGHRVPQVRTKASSSRRAREGQVALSQVPRRVRQPALTSSPTSDPLQSPAPQLSRRHRARLGGQTLGPRPLPSPGSGPGTQRGAFSSTDTACNAYARSP